MMLLPLPLLPVGATTVASSSMPASTVGGKRRVRNNTKVRPWLLRLC